MTASAATTTTTTTKYSNSGGGDCSSSSNSVMVKKIKHMNAVETIFVLTVIEFRKYWTVYIILLVFYFVHKLAAEPYYIFCEKSLRLSQVKEHNCHKSISPFTFKK
jgi:hypothetical protein